LNKYKLIIIICFSILKSDEITSSCKDYKYEKCLSNHWEFEDKDKENALKHYTKAINYINDKKLRKSYSHIVKAREIISQEKTINSKMTKNIYSGSALRPRQKIYKTEIKNIYNIKILEMNNSMRNTAQPLLIVECAKNNSNIYLYNIDKSFKDNKKIDNMNLSDIVVSINNKKLKLDEIDNGDMRQLKVDINKCQNLKVSMKATNSLFDDKAISKIKLITKGNL